MKNVILLINTGLLLIYCSCSNLSKHETIYNKTNTDSLEISNLVREAYKWYTVNSSQIYFDVIVKDSFQVGLDTIKLRAALNKMQSTKLFNADFIKNYEMVGLAVNNKLKSGRYYNEINFNFQDADIWTSSQDDESDLWKRLKIKELQIKGDVASLKWYTDDYMYFGYLVKMKKESGTWKISYLEGLEYKNAVE